MKRQSPERNVQPTALHCEYLTHPLAIESKNPRLGWELECRDPLRKDVRQTAYRIVVMRDDGKRVWDSGRTESDQQGHIRYAGMPLQPGERYHWKVQIWDDRGQSSAWSAPALWAMGIEGPGWTHDRPEDSPPPPAAAEWICLPLDDLWHERQSQPSPMFRKEFTVSSPVRRATLYVSALGVYEARLNGERIGDQVLAPEWTDYRQKVQYQAYDVTAHLRKGANVLGAFLGPGWYSGRLGMAEWLANTSRGVYGRRLAWIAQLRIDLVAGRKLTIGTDASWECTSNGPIRASDLLDGETYDARREMKGWDRPAFRSTAWGKVAKLKGPRLVAQPNEPIRITRRLQPRALTKRAPGTYVFDLGQNLVGWCRIRAHHTKAGQKITLRHAEMLNADGTIYFDNMRGASPIDRFICRGSRNESFEPHFTYHGFRYVEVTGLSRKPSLDDLMGCVFHSSAPEVGAFECSSDLLNRIHSAIQWTQRGNLHSTPTDCPQRDERLGWMGDAQVFSQTAIFNMNMAAFFTKWIRDIREAQADDGRFPDFAPHPYDPNQRFSGNPGWGDAGIIIPWRLYLNYGDTAILEEQFEAAKRYVDWSVKHNPDLIWRNNSQLSPVGYGDWLNADTFTGLPGFPPKGGQVPKDIYATAFFAHSADLVARMAHVLRRNQDATKYNRLSKNIRTAFNRMFVSRNGKIQGDTQAGYALALSFDLLPPNLRPLAARHLVSALKPYHGSLSTGIQSTVRMMMELSRYGYHDEAYALMTKTTIPSWGYMVEHGGTTIWERWDGWVEGRGFQNPGMNSFNHYAIGAVGEWMYRVIGGINPDENVPGWKHCIIRPVPGGGLTWAKVGYHSPRGPIRSHWQLQGDRFTLEVTVPPNTRATVILPGKSVRPQGIGSGTHSFATKY